MAIASNKAYRKRYIKIKRNKQNSSETIENELFSSMFVFFSMPYFYLTLNLGTQCLIWGEDGPTRLKVSRIYVNFRWSSTIDSNPRSSGKVKGGFDNSTWRACTILREQFIWTVTKMQITGSRTI